MRKLLVGVLLILSVGAEDSFDDPGINPPQDEKFYREAFKESRFVTESGKVYKGDEIKAPVVLLNFWASWCSPCLAEFPLLITMKRQFKDDEVLLLAVNADRKDQKEKIDWTKGIYNFNFPIVADDGRYTTEFGIATVPITLVYYQGEMIQRIEGSADYASPETIAFLRKLVTEAD